MGGLARKFDLKKSYNNKNERFYMKNNKIIVYDIICDKQSYDFILL